MLDLQSTLLLAAAALGAGALNAVAGGGSFLTLPALVAIGVPPVVANATGTVALLPGYASATWGFRNELEAPPGLRIRTVVACALGGGLVGAALLLVTPEEAFRVIVPWLLLAATALFAGTPLLKRTRRQHNRTRPVWMNIASITAVCIYGGYFNGGLGILLLAVLGALGQANLQAANGVKNLVSTVLTAIAVAVYTVGDLVRWPEALLMMLAATVGGYLGAHFGRRIPDTLMRSAIVLIGIIMTVLFFIRS